MRVIEAAPEERAEAVSVAAMILRLTAARGPADSVSPIDVARALVPGPGDEWRRKLGEVRREAARLATDGRIQILRKGKPINPTELRGVIRLRIASS